MRAWFTLLLINSRKTADSADTADREFFDGPAPRNAAFALLAVAMTLAAAFPGAAQERAPKTFGGAQIQEIIRIRLDRDDLLLESIEQAIKKYGIEDGALLTAAGSLQQCTFHGVTTLDPKPVDKFYTKKEPMEILSINGIIAAGEPHFHMTLASVGGAAFGGHLEPGCKVLYRAELTLAKFSGTKLARKPNKDGVPVLQAK